VAIVAIASVGVTLSMRDSAQSQLETEAQRLTAVLESARAQSRASGAPVRWRATATGYTLNNKPQTWASPGISASSDQPLVLGPEPIIAPQRVRLWVTDQAQRSVVIFTDGVRPFSVQSATP
jgi:general secretion pathway protein H